MLQSRLRKRPDRAVLADRPFKLTVQNLNLVRWPGSGVAIEHARHPSDAKRVDDVGTTLLRL